MSGTRVCFYPSVVSITASGVLTVVLAVTLYEQDGFLFHLDTPCPSWALHAATTACQGTGL